MINRQEVGNAIPTPGYSRTGFSNDPEILNSTNPGSYFQKGVTLKPGGGLLEAGTFLKQDPDSKLYERATTAAEADGVLRAKTQTGSAQSDPTFQGNILFKGNVQFNKIVAANPAVDDVTEAFGGARADEERNFFIF